MVKCEEVNFLRNQGNSPLSLFMNSLPSFEKNQRYVPSLVFGGLV